MDRRALHNTLLKRIAPLYEHPMNLTKLILITRGFVKIER
ncbi:hypothetical protein NBRC111894_3748 [Sporolactobacillus inulinus]|uniref:Uncharacterized protein n=1 Tax=Sporolactobacillus inulinus TaxID=2078 RepID=A0A4Y1ZH23_9BACL|nr:hypothetical protein NBRC111894_3748 [Sporolactobacillus inulinus]